MKDFKKLPKMKCGGGVKKYSGEDGSHVTKDFASKYQKFVDSGADVDPGMGRKPTKPYVDIDPGMTRQRPKTPVVIPGVGEMKESPVRLAPSGRGMLLKKGGKVKCGNKK